MRRKWQVSRSLITKAEGERCWECAYQLLWEWSQTATQPLDDASGESDESSLPKRHTFQQEAEHASRPLSASLDQQSGPETDN